VRVASCSLHAEITAVYALSSALLFLLSPAPRVRRAPHAVPAVALSAAAPSPDVLFGVANAVVIPVYGLMLLAPRSRLVRRPRRALQWSPA
jgi:hypothetical protein